MNTSTSLPDMSVIEPRGRIWSNSSTRTASSSAIATPSRPGIPHSTSSPALSKPGSPSLHSPGTPSTPNRQQPKNYHPYLIQSTSSSLLTRTNSSPAPLPDFTGHRSSRSLSSFEYAGVRSSEKIDDRRKSLDTPASPSPMRPVRKGRNDILGAQTKMGEGSKADDLPIDPKLWTPSELASYLSLTLRNGGDDGSGHRLPAPLVEDIKSWVLRHQVTGRAFLRGNSDTWGKPSRPPPFISLLQSISRKLRRASLQNNPSDSLDDKDTVLLETDEEDDERLLTGVKRMANAFEARTGYQSDSSASDIEDVPRIQAQLTGGSEGWERWGVKRHRSTSRSDAEEARDLTPSSPEEMVVTPLIEQAEAAGVAITENEDDESQEGTIKAPPPNLVAALSPSNVENVFDDLAGHGHVARLGIQRSNSAEGTPKAGQASGREITPTPDRVRPSTAGLGFSPEEIFGGDGSPRPQPSTSLRYGSLRSKGRVPSVQTSQEDGYTTSDEAPTQRRTTLRPTVAALNALFDDTKTEREKELEKELAQVMERVKVLEDKLTASRPATPDTRGMQSLVDVILGRSADDGLPRRVGELPGYLFLVGVGVGAVMMRVLFGRAR